MLYLKALALTAATAIVVVSAGWLLLWMVILWPVHVLAVCALFFVYVYWIDKLERAETLAREAAEPDESR